MWYRMMVFMLALSSAGMIQAQTPSTVRVRALEPQARDFERLNLVTAWRMYLPLKNEGDSVSVVQPINDRVYVQLRSGLLLAIQAYSNPKTFRKPGDVIWQFQATQFAGTPLPVAVISKLAEIDGKSKPITELYAVFGQRLFVLDAADGKMKFTEEMPSTAAAGPIADESSVFIPLSNRSVVCFSHTKYIAGYTPKTPVRFPDPIKKISLAVQPADNLSTTANRSPSITPLDRPTPPFMRSDSVDQSPSVGTLKNVQPPYQAIDASRSPSVAHLHNLRDIYELSSKSAPTRVKKQWEVLVDGKLTMTPIIYSRDSEVKYHSGDIPDQAELVVMATGRSVVSFPATSIGVNAIKTEYITPAEVTAPLTAHKDSLYICTADSGIMCLSIKQLADSAMARSILPRGKFTTGGMVTQAPFLVDDSLYVIGERWGLIRLKKTTLEPMWVETLNDGRTRPAVNDTITKVLAANAKYVYGLDRNGKLVILDARRGTTLSSFDVSAFSVSVTNGTNDRLFLTSPTGLLLCVHDRNLVTPQRWRVGNRDVEAAPPAKKEGEAAPAEPKMDPAEPKKDP